MQRNSRVIPIHESASRDCGDGRSEHGDDRIPEFDVDGWEPSLLERMRRAARRKPLKNRQS